MPLKNDLKNVFKELSPILAGFKLALIVISYFGVGSLAKWIIQYWYPFTRWVWDQITFTLSLPELPIIIKDSLTALVFFLPLGLTAIYQIFKPAEIIHSLRYRTIAGFLGVIFLYFVTKGVTDEIIKSLGG